jgi:hypothetical protein
MVPFLIIPNQSTMKKFYLLLIVFATTNTFAQTLDQSDLPFAGLGWTSGVDTSYSASVPAGGTGQSWDFSGLQYDYVDTSGFADASGTPYAGIFPTSNLASHDLSTGDWSYFTNSSNGFYVNGFVTNAVPFVISPPQLYVPVPFSYGNTQTNISRVEIDTIIQGFAAKIIINFHADFEADGSGSLITPAATYPSVLRVKETMLETDSFLIDYIGQGSYTLISAQQTQTTSYRWFTHGATANYIMGITADSIGTTATQSDYLIQWAVLGTNDLNVSNFLKVYPDPGTEYVTISNGTIPCSSLDVYNILGENVYSASSNSFGQAELKLNVSDWTPGIFYFTVKAGMNTTQGKFTVQH